MAEKQEPERTNLEGGYIEFLQGATDGNIEPFGESTVPHGSNKSYLIVANTGYKIGSIIIDGNPIVPVPVSPYTHTFTSVVADHSIGVSFTVAEVDTHNITISIVSGGGTTTPPVGTHAVPHGTDFSVGFAPATGQRVTDIKIDNVSIGTLTSPYIFTNVTADHTFSIIFGAIPVVQGGNAIFTGSRWTTGGNINCTTAEDFTIGTLGNTSNYGTIGQVEGTAISSNSTTGYSAGGMRGGIPIGTVTTFVFATKGAALQHNNIQLKVAGREGHVACGNTTKGFFAGGEGSLRWTIEYFTYANLTSGVEHGRLARSVWYGGSCGNAVRGIVAGGMDTTNYPSQGQYLNAIEYFSLSTAGNAANFGLLWARKGAVCGASNPTRGIFCADGDSSYITIATTGNSSNFSSLLCPRVFSAACASSTRYVIGGGVPEYTSHGPGNRDIDYMTFSTMNKCSDFGSLIYEKFRTASASNCHGGLSNPPTLYYTISTQVLSGEGTISPTPSVSIVAGGETIITMTAASGWKVSEINVNGAIIAGTPLPSTYKFKNIQSNQTITVRFSQVERTLTASITPTNAGTVTPTTQSVPNGGTGTITCAINEGYIVESINGMSGSLPTNIHITPNLAKVTTITVDDITMNTNIDLSAIADNRAGNAVLCNNEGLSSHAMYYITIETESDAKTFGSLTSRSNSAAASNATQGVRTCGNSRSMDYFVIATKCNSTVASGQWPTSCYSHAGMSNATRMIIAGGATGERFELDSTAYVNHSNLATVSAGGGGLCPGRQSLCGLATPTIAVIAGGYWQEPYFYSATSRIEYTSFSTVAAVTEFGHLTEVRSEASACTNGIHGLIIGGHNQTSDGYYRPITGDWVRTVQRFTISSKSNATNFGQFSNSSSSRNGSGTGNLTRGIFASVTDWTGSKHIQYISYGTASAVYSFGDLVGAPSRSGRYDAVSSSHGGL